jgi:WD40 repeat protein
VRDWDTPAPGEREAGDRSWDVVRAAYDERIRVPRKRDWRPIAIAAAAAVVIAGAVTPVGHAVLGSLRDAVRGEPNAAPALFALPTPHSRLLVSSADGIWVVQSDGSKRLLRGYHDPSWSPHGLYVAAVRTNELRALEPNGAVHWSIGRTGLIRAPRWSFDGFRVAYFAGPTLRVINGDGTRDHVLTRAARPGMSAWQPSSHSLAYVNAAGNIVVRNVDRTAQFAVIRTRLTPRQLQWTPDGRLLVAVGPRTIGIFGQRGPQIRRIDTDGATIAASSVSPDGKRIAFIEMGTGRSSLQVTGTRAGPTREVFKGVGIFANVAWAPDGRSLLLDWSSTNQWLFIHSRPVKKIVAVSNIRTNFGDEPSLAGWCCP